MRDTRDSADKPQEFAPQEHYCSGAEPKLQTACEFLEGRIFEYCAARGVDPKRDIASLYFSEYLWRDIIPRHIALENEFVEKLRTTAEDVTSHYREHPRESYPFWNAKTRICSSKDDEADRLRLQLEASVAAVLYLSVVIAESISVLSKVLNRASGADEFWKESAVYPRVKKLKPDAEKRDNRIYCALVRSFVEEHRHPPEIIENLLLLPVWRNERTHAEYYHAYVNGPPYEVFYSSSFNVLRYGPRRSFTSTQLRKVFSATSALLSWWCNRSREYIRYAELSEKLTEQIRARKSVTMFKVKRTKQYVKVLYERDSGIADYQDGFFTIEAEIKYMAEQSGFEFKKSRGVARRELFFS